MDSIFDKITFDGPGPSVLPTVLEADVVCKCGHIEKVYGLSPAEVQHQEWLYGNFKCTGCLLDARYSIAQKQKEKAAQ